MDTAACYGLLSKGATSKSTSQSTTSPRIADAAAAEGEKYDGGYAHSDSAQSLVRELGMLCVLSADNLLVLVCVMRLPATHGKIARARARALVAAQIEAPTPIDSSKLSSKAVAACNETTERHSHAISGAVRQLSERPAVNITLDVVRAGRSTFTVDNGTGKHYTFRVTRKEPTLESGYTHTAWFIALLTGPNNDADYSYLGMLTSTFQTSPRGEVPGPPICCITAKSCATSSSTAVRVFDFAMRVVAGVQPLPNGYSIKHDGACARCGRKLTTPESLDAGLGPVCRSLGQ